MQPLGFNQYLSRLAATVAKAAPAVFLSTTALFTGCAKEDSGQPESAAAEGPAIVKEGDAYRLTQGSMSATITPLIGGRVASFQYNGREMLLTPEQSDNLLWGSVLWSGPQQDWGWPPLPTLDSEPYKVVELNDRLTLTSDVDPKLGYQFTKSYGFDEETGEFLLDYTIHNKGTETRELAAWEVTRVPAEGVVFFPTGETEGVTGGMNPLPIERRGSITWFEYDPDKLEGDHKLMIDGAGGWMAHVSDGYLFLKQFEDVPVEKNVEGEAEIHVYTDPTKTYIELEQQGPVTVLQPGESLNWQVRWSVKPWAEGAEPAAAVPN
jgi:hypothetical protein